MLLADIYSNKCWNSPQAAFNDYLKSCRPMDIPGDELLMSDVGTLTISLSKLCELKKKYKKNKKSNKKLVS